MTESQATDATADRAYDVRAAQSFSSGDRVWDEDVSLGRFDTYEEAVVFAKGYLDRLRHTADHWADDNPMMSDYDRDDAFVHGGGLLRIEPEPDGAHFSAADYFFGDVA